MTCCGADENILQLFGCSSNIANEVSCTSIKVTAAVDQQPPQQLRPIPLCVSADERLGNADSQLPAERLTAAQSHACADAAEVRWSTLEGSGTRQPAIYQGSSLSVKVSSAADDADKSLCFAIHSGEEEAEHRQSTPVEMEEEDAGQGVSAAAVAQKNLYPEPKVSSKFIAPWKSGERNTSERQASQRPDERVDMSAALRFPGPEATFPKFRSCPIPDSLEEEAQYTACCAAAVIEDLNLRCCSVPSTSMSLQLAVLAVCHISQPNCFARACQSRMPDANISCTTPFDKNDSYMQCLCNFCGDWKLL